MNGFTIALLTFMVVQYKPVMAVIVPDGFYYPFTVKLGWFTIAYRK
jgi:hypothetical protein